MYTESLVRTSVTLVGKVRYTSFQNWHNHYKVTVTYKDRSEVFDHYQPTSIKSPVTREAVLAHLFFSVLWGDDPYDSKSMTKAEYNECVAECQKLRNLLQDDYSTFFG